MSLSHTDSHRQRLIDNIIQSDDSYREQLIENISQYDQQAIQMVIELDENTSIAMMIRADDEPFLLAKKFCYANNIDPKIINSLAMNISKIQASSFEECGRYKSLFGKDADFKQNQPLLSNARTTDTGLQRSKLSKHSRQKNHTTTFMDQTTGENAQSHCSQSNLHKSNVFQRLYHDSKEKNAKRLHTTKQLRTAKQASARKPQHNSQCETQIRIYNKNMKLKQATIHRNEQLRDQAEQTDNCDHIPQINSLSRMIAHRLRDLNYDPHSKSKQKTSWKVRQYLNKKQQNEMSQCTFHPKILKRSQKQTLNTDRYVLLHEDHLLRENKMETVKASEMKTMFETRNPKINQISKKIVGNKSFETRLQQYKVSNEKNKRKILEESFNECRFKPQLYRQSARERKGHQSIGEYLYSKSKQKSRKHILDPQHSPKHVNRMSQKLYEDSKRNAFHYIFTLMDNDEDGFISSLKINILGLSPDILKLLAPLLCEMEEVQIQLDEEEFVQSIQRLFQTFTVHQKNLILNVYKNPLRKSKIKQEHSYHPSLNEKSVEMVRETRDPNTSLYDLGKQKFIQKEARLSKMRALKAMLEQQQCTFQPNLFHHHY